MKGEGEGEAGGGGGGGDTPVSRLTAARGSLRCLVLGILSLIPVVGVVFGVMAISKAAQVRRLRRGQWNPGSQSLRWGVGFAVAGILLFLGSMGAVGWAAIQMMVG